MANLVRGGASAVAALALPHFLTHALDRDRFAAWVLMLQIAAYANYLDFGLQTAVARFFAQAMELREYGRRDRLVSTAFALLSAAGLSAFCILALVVWQFQHIFHNVPVQMISELRSGLLILASFAAGALPMSAFTGVLIGLHRNEYPAIAIGGSRILGVVSVLISVRYTSSLVWLAFFLGFFNFLGSLIQVFIANRLLPSMRVRFLNFHRGLGRELIYYCATLTVWSFGMLLVTGLDVTIVAYFDFTAVGYYSIAATLIGFFTGLNGSIFGAMLTPVAVLQARKEYGQIRRLITAATQINSYLCIALTIAAFLFGEQLLGLWVGKTYAAQAIPIVEILLSAQTVRLMGSAYGTVLVAIGQHHRGLFTVMIEAGLNLALSVMGMAVVGTAGVAWATLIAAAVALAMQFLVVMPRVSEISLARKQYARRAIIQPLLALLAPLVWLGLRGWYENYFQPSELGRVLPLILSLLIAAWLTWTGIRRDFPGGKTPLSAV